MNQADAKSVIAAGTDFRTLRETMVNEYDGVPSKTIRDFTRDEAHRLLRAYIDGKDGPVDPDSPDGLAGQLILREFAE